jgi:hypothetical protein
LPLLHWTWSTICGQLQAFPAAATPNLAVDRRGDVCRQILTDGAA